MKICRRMSKKNCTKMLMRNLLKKKFTNKKIKTKEWLV